MREVNRLSLVVHRLLRSQILFPTKLTAKMKTMDSVDFLRVLDRIVEVSGGTQRIIESVPRILEQPPPKSILDPLLEMCVKVQDAYNWSIQALMSKDVPLANRVLDEELEMNNLWDLLVKVEQKTQISVPIFSHIHRIMDNLKQMNVYTREIATIAIDRAEEYE